VEGTTEHIVLQTILLIAAAPVMEEFVFRRCLIDRLSPYGEKAALVTSALLFALFHETVNQVFYAFLLGLVLGYVYLKTGRLRITVVLHMLVNSLSMVVLPALLTAALRASPGMNAERVQLISVIREPGVIVLLVYFTVLFVLTLLGAVLFFYGVRERDLSEDGIRGRDVISSWGMVLFFAVSAGMLLVG
jgi:membrane protease YdiL (CAAX protease family)